MATGACLQGARTYNCTVAQCLKNVLLSYYHAYFSIGIDSFIHSFRIKGNEAHQIRCILRMRLRMDRADPGHRHRSHVLCYALQSTYYVLIYMELPECR